LLLLLLFFVVFDMDIDIAIVIDIVLDCYYGYCRFPVYSTLTSAHGHEAIITLPRHAHNAVHVLFHQTNNEAGRFDAYLEHRGINITSVIVIITTWLLFILFCFSIQFSSK
jgi:hypothetical protein